MAAVPELGTSIPEMGITSSRVFIGGSRRITRLEAEVRRRLDRIVEKGLPVVIGDANGADKAVQRYLNDRQFEKVEVFSADASPRNNAGGWPVRVIRPGHARRDFDYYAAKDGAMAAGRHGRPDALGRPEPRDADERSSACGPQQARRRVRPAQERLRRCTDTQRRLGSSR